MNSKLLARKLIIFLWIMCLFFLLTLMSFHGAAAEPQVIRETVVVEKKVEVEKEVEAEVLVTATSGNPTPEPILETTSKDYITISDTLGILKLEYPTLMSPGLSNEVSVAIHRPSSLKSEDPLLFNEKHFIFFDIIGEESPHKTVIPLTETMTVILFEGEFDVNNSPQLTQSVVISDVNKPTFWKWTITAPNELDTHVFVIQIFHGEILKFWRVVKIKVQTPVPGATGSPNPTVTTSSTAANEPIPSSTSTNMPTLLPTRTDTPKPVPTLTTLPTLFTKVPNPTHEKKTPTTDPTTVPGSSIASTISQIYNNLITNRTGLVGLLFLLFFGITSVWFIVKPHHKGNKIHQSVASKHSSSLPEKYFNPYIVGKHVSGGNFIGRQFILTDLITALKAGNHLLIEGERRIGKTSVLHRLAERLRQDSDYCFIPAYVQLQRVTEERLFDAIMRAVAREGRRRYKALPALASEASYAGYDSFDAEDDLHVVIETFEQISDLPLRVVILLDEGDRLREFSEEAHSQLRGWMGADQQDLLLLVWCGVSFDKAWHQRTSPWYNQFRSSLEIPPLSPSVARELITRPVEGYYSYEEQAIERILALSECKPFIIQLICDGCVMLIWDKKSGALITETDVDEVWPLVEERLQSDAQAELVSQKEEDEQDDDGKSV